MGGLPDLSWLLSGEHPGYLSGDRAAAERSMPFNPHFSDKNVIRREAWNQQKEPEIAKSIFTLDTVIELVEYKQKNIKATLKNLK